MEAISIWVSAALNSRLVSASAAALFTLVKALPTSVSPPLKVTPLATKPTTGISAMAMMRLRTESFTANRGSANLVNIDGIGKA